MSFTLFLLSCLYFALPAYVANMTPPLAKKAGILKWLEKPVDFGKVYGGAPLLGAHKTWRGVILGILVGMIVIYFQRYLYRFSFFQEISFFDYREVNIFLFAFLFSFGAVFGDLLFSFFKRRLGMRPGQRWLPFDQTDYIIGLFLIITPYLKLGVHIWLTIFIFTFFLHIIFNRLGYELKLHESKW